MKSDKEIKKEFKLDASQNPEKYYATTVLDQEGFVRGCCEKCQTYFWSVDKDRKICGDPSCSGGFDVVENNPSKVQMSYIDVWKKIVSMLEPRGYKPVNRYPVVARWNPTAEFTMASIAAFQPYVISGEVKPPAKKLLIPQFSLRFGDIDNVGITGSHLTGFVMIGQHQFVSQDEWSQEQAFRDIYEFITIGVGLDKKELTLHEDAWAGGGNFGPCMEFFSRGVELFNQVYMMFEQTPDGVVPLKLKVLDMGLGMERVAWFSQGLPNIYEATFPLVLQKLREKVKVSMDFDLYKKFSKYSSYLNVDEVENIDEAWNDVADKLGIKVVDLKEKIMPMTAIYSIAEHSRALLFALTDGGLPSNVGGGYNLRVILRRALSFIDKFKWDIELADVADWHAAELKEIFPELSDSLSNVRAILNVEKQKYEATKENAKKIVEKIIKSEVTTEKLLELYDSHGISPDMIKESALALGKKINVPDDFYKLVSERHEQKEQVHQTNKEYGLDLDEIEETAVGYFEDEKIVEFEAKIVYVKDEFVVLDKTYFYPTSGGQVHDIGTINGLNVIDVFKQGKIIVHKVENNTFEVGDIAKGSIDFERRLQLMQLHSATHVVNAVAGELFGEHINQAGAKKTIEKASLDVTHYENITPADLIKIEERANEIIKKDLKVIKQMLPRDKAEELYGMKIYQGGAVPGKELRIVDFGGIDVEACGGTHVDKTSEIGFIKMQKSSKIQDGIVRLEFVAGKLAVELENEEKEIIETSMKILGCSKELLVSRSVELFKLWKKAGKLSSKVKSDNYLELIKNGEVEANLDFCSSDVVDENILETMSKELKTQKKMIVKTLERFKDEFDKNKKIIEDRLNA